MRISFASVIGFGPGITDHFHGVLSHIHRFHTHTRTTGTNIKKYNSKTRNPIRMDLVDKGDDDDDEVYSIK